MVKVLVIRFRRVGDAVLTSSICTTLKHSIPDCEIHYVLNENIAPLFEHHPDIDKVITFSDKEKHSFFTYLKKIRQIMKEGKYDIIIDSRSTLNTMYFPLFSLKSKYRIGRKKNYTNFIYNYRINNTFDKTKDIIQQLLCLVEPLNKVHKIEKDPVFKLYCTDQEKEVYKQYMKSCGIDFSKPIILCAVSVRLEHKMWPKEKMKELLLNILNKYDVQLIFNYGSDAEKQTAKQIYEELNCDSHIFTNIEAKNLKELVALLRNSDFFFGNEGGARHISQALDIPSFAIYPPNTSLRNWLPNSSDRFRGIELFDIDPYAATDKNLSYIEKFDMINVEQVWTKLEEMLNTYLPQKTAEENVENKN